MEEIEEELFERLLMMKVKEESEKVGLKVNIKTQNKQTKQTCPSELKERSRNFPASKN